MDLNPLINETQDGIFRKIGRGRRRETRYDIMKTMSNPERRIESKSKHTAYNTHKHQFKQRRLPIYPSLWCVEELIRCLLIKCMSYQQYEYKGDQWSSCEFDKHSQRKNNYRQEIV